MNTSNTLNKYFISLGILILTTLIYWFACIATNQGNGADKLDIQVLFVVYWFFSIIAGLSIIILHLSRLVKITLGQFFIFVSTINLVTGFFYVVESILGDWMDGTNLLLKAVAFLPLLIGLCLISVRNRERRQRLSCN